MDSGGASLQDLPPGLDAETPLRTAESQPSTDAGPLKGIMVPATDIYLFGPTGQLRTELGRVVQ